MKCGGASPTTRRFPRFPVRAPQAAAACSRLNWRDVSMGPGVTVNCFHPGLVATGFNRNNGLRRCATPGAQRPDPLPHRANRAQMLGLYPPWMKVGAQVNDRRGSRGALELVNDIALPCLMALPE